MPAGPEFTTRDQFIAYFVGKPLPDGRLIALPGDDDLILCASGVRLSDLTPIGDGSGHYLHLDFVNATGHYRPHGQGDQRPIAPGEPSWLGVTFGTDTSMGNDHGYVSSLLFTISTWIEHGWAAQVYSALNKWAFFWCEAADAAARYAIFPTIIPGDEEQSTTGPDDMPVRELDPMTEVFNPVSLVTPPQGGQGLGYMRSWFVPQKFAPDFAAMMTARFGEPGEAMVDAEAMQAHQAEILTPLPGVWDEWVALEQREDTEAEVSMAQEPASESHCDGHLIRTSTPLESTGDRLTTWLLDGQAVTGEIAAALIRGWYTPETG